MVESPSARGLSEVDAGADPIALFDRWFAEARAAGLPQPEAMALATTDPDGQPSARMVLLKDFSPAGFTFYTNYDGRKSRELDENPRACLLFFWSAHERQVRIEGRAARVSAAESEAYFRTRPRDSRIGAWASPQSEVIPDRATLERSFAEACARFGDGEVPCPPHWGGFRVEPEVIEFWQGRPSRLHDRLAFCRRGDRWTVERLAP
jgi:pyridoxamine 5'-phosphate oxidase